MFQPILVRAFTVVILIAVFQALLAVWLLRLAGTRSRRRALRRLREELREERWRRSTRQPSG